MYVTVLESVQGRVHVSVERRERGHRFDQHPHKTRVSPVESEEKHTDAAESEARRPRVRSSFSIVTFGCVNNARQSLADY